MVKVSVEGVSAVQAAFKRLEHELSAREMVGILRGAARPIIKSSRTHVQLKGSLNQATKRDIGVVKSRVVRGKAEVNLGLRFKFYDIGDTVQKVAPIVRHFTEGFKQSQRSSDGRSRGRVKARTGDFMERGFNASQVEQMAGINAEINKRIAKL